MQINYTAIHTGILNILASIALLGAPALAETVPLEQHTEAKSLPEIAYLDSTGTRQTLDASPAKITILHLWATWCIPCIAELPELARFAEAHSDRITVLPLSLDKPDNLIVESFYVSHNISGLPVVFDIRMAAFRALGIRALPATIFINSDGKEIARISGPANWQDKEITDFIKSASPH